MSRLRPRRRLNLKGAKPASAPPPEANPELTAALLAAVEKQLSTGKPAATRETLIRLVAEGYTPEGARQLIANAVAREIFAVMSRGEPYDSARYEAALRRLPREEEG